MKTDPENSLQGASPKIPGGRLDRSIIADGLGTAVIGKNIHLLDEIESTNLTAGDLAHKGSADGMVVLAEAQTAGKGRMGRAWISPPFQNLYLSVILEPNRHHDRLGIWTLAAAVAVADAIESRTGLAVDLKWPNDLRIGGKKIGGLLLESTFQGNRVRHMVLGVGINVNIPIEEFPEDLRSTASSLAAILGVSVDRNQLCRSILQGLDIAYRRFMDGAFPDLLEAYRAKSETRNKRIQVQSARDRLTGTAVDFSEEGALILKTETGRMVTVRSDEVIHLGDAHVAGD